MGYICPRPIFSHTRLSVNSSDLFSFTFLHDPSVSVNERSVMEAQFCFIAHQTHY